MRKVQHLLSVQHSVRCFVVRIGSHLPSRPGMSRVFIHAIVPSIGTPLPKFLVHCGRIGVHWKVKLCSHLDMETSSVHDSTYDLAHAASLGKFGLILSGCFDVHTQTVAVQTVATPYSIKCQLSSVTQHRSQQCSGHFLCNTTGPSLCLLNIYCIRVARCRRLAISRRARTSVALKWSGAADRLS